MKWRIFIHGGAADSCPDVSRQTDIKEALGQIIARSSKLLDGGAHAKDVVVDAIKALEDCSLFNAGKGSALTRDGSCELEAGIVDGASGHYGAVCCMKETKNPILTASALADHGPHCLLVGKAADDHTKHLGLEAVPNDYFITPFRRTYWERSSQANGNDAVDEMGTVGALVLDSWGNLAAGGSTGGTTGKLSGRVGDTAVLGAGLFASDRVALVCSGAGDQILQHLVANKAANYYMSGLDLANATRRAVMDMSVSGKSCSIAAIDFMDEVSVSSTAKVFYTASVSSLTDSSSVLMPPNCQFMSNHLVHNDARLAIGLSRYPTTKGQLIAQLNQPMAGNDLFSLDRSSILGIFQVMPSVAAACCQTYNVQRCALVTEGAHSISIIPLHGVSRKWQRITHDGEKEFHEGFPGYVTSKDGPSMDESKLDEICRRIQAVSETVPPFNNTFFGDKSDMNLFARIVRGELPQRRIWENEQHVAFLTPFANTIGFTVLVPRTHLQSDILSLNEADYSQLVKAAHTVAQVLKRSLGAQRIGMIFEGFEIDYAHVKLIPIPSPLNMFGSSQTGDLILQEEYHERYPGYVTSLQGPVARDTVALSSSAETIRKYLQRKNLKAPKFWMSPERHTLGVLQSAWYSNLVAAQNSLFHASVVFFHKTVGYKYAFVPATTDAISSPMGLGSDSLPVSISFLGKETRLADSMQFALEYFLRIHDGLPGVYYINNSFRGEDSDSMHLNQFYHVECELLGDFEAGIAVAERYITNITSTFLLTGSQTVKAVTCSCDHLQSLLDLYHSHGNSFPRITLDQALQLPIMDASTWRYTIPSQPTAGRTITRAGEQKLIRHFGGAVWLTEMDHLSVPFYQAYADSTTRTKGLCADFLLGNGEVMGLGERHQSRADVQSALDMHQTDAAAYKWYMDMRDAKTLLTTGWGMGVERFLAWVLGHDDIRDLVVMPRMKGVDFSP